MTLRLGYSPYFAPRNGIGPFSELFPNATNLAYCDSLKGIDAIVLWGGEDISPTVYAEKPIRGSGPAEPTERDLFELELMRVAHKAGKPILGVCRGAQFICAFAGGKLVQNVSGHTQNHIIQTEDMKQFFVTSAHHQMLYPFDVAHQMLAWSAEKRSGCYDGISLEEREKIYDEPEVVFFPEVNGFAVQCHPEWHEEHHPFNKWMMGKIKSLCLGN